MYSMASARVLLLNISTISGLHFSHVSSGILGAFELLPGRNTSSWDLDACERVRGRDVTSLGSGRTIFTLRPQAAMAAAQ
jgi:hypothetical protein